MSNKPKLVRPMTKDEIRDSGWVGWMGDERLFFVLDVDASKEKVMQELAEIALRDKDGAYVINNTYSGCRVVGWGYTPKGYANTPKGPKLWLLAMDGDKRIGVEGFNPVALRERR